MKLKVGGLLLIGLGILLLAFWAGMPSVLRSEVKAVGAVATSVPAPSGGTNYQPNTHFSCDQVAPPSRAICEANPPNPYYQGGVPAIQPAIQPAGQPGLLSADVSRVTTSEAAVRSYISTHLTVNGAPPVISKVELLPVSTVNARIGGGIQGPGNALVYVVRVQGPITVDTSVAPVTGPYENLFFGAATGNYLGRQIPPDN